MLMAILLSILYAIGFVVFGAVLASIVSLLLAPRIERKLDVNSTNQRTRKHDQRRLVLYTSVLTSAIVCGVLGLIAMIHDGPISHYW